MSSSEQQEMASEAPKAAVSPARSDRSSDSEGRPVREKFQKTSIDATANPTSLLGQNTTNVANGTVKPGSRSASGSDSDRGRLRRKRSREDIEDDNEADKQPDKKQERLEKSSARPERHVRKRSRDITKDLESGALAKPTTTSVARIDEADAEMASPSKGTSKPTETNAQTSTSPKNKRPRDDAEGSKAVDANTNDASVNGQAATKADERESKRVRDKEEPKPATIIPAGSGFANTSAASPFAAMAAKPAPPKTSEKTEGLPQTSDDKFKASGFGSLASSSASPFGGFAAAAKSGSPFGSAPKLSSFASPAATPSTTTTSSGTGFGSLGGAKTGFGGGSVFGGATNSPFGGTFASKQPGANSFATPGAPGITGLSSKPERAFGAPGDKPEEEDASDQDDDDADKAEKDTEEDRRPSQSAAPKETGEENETSAWIGRAKLYTMDGEGKERGWKERGVGNIKLNVTLDEPRKARFVLRADGTHRLILNAAVTKQMVFGADSQGAKPKDGRLLFNSPTADGELEMHLLKLKSERAVELWEQVAKVQEEEL
jgi:Ran-binding protein 3